MIRRREPANRFAIYLAASFAVLLFVSGCGKEAPPDTRAADAAALRDADAQWSKTAGAKDVDGAVSFYSDDASVLPPNAPLAADKASIRAVWAELLAPDNSVSWQATKVDVARSGDLGYVMGTYQMSGKDAQGKPTSDRGKFLEVWKKQADGKWKAVADIFNSDLPVAAPPPPAKSHSRHHTSSHKKHHTHRHSSAN